MVRLMSQRVEQVLMTLSRTATPLLDCTNIAGRVGRRGFCSAVLLATSLMVIGYAMDWFVFGSVRLGRPDVFACFVGAVLVVPLLTLGVRRLRDTDRSGWLILFVFVPVAGWLLLARWWCEPSDRNSKISSFTKCQVRKAP